MHEHELKTWPVPFRAVVSGAKLHEIRTCRDRNFAPGDVLRLREWDPATTQYTGDEVYVQVTYVTSPGSWNLPDDVCVMSIRKLAMTSKPPTAMITAIAFSIALRVMMSRGRRFFRIAFTSA